MDAKILQLLFSRFQRKYHQINPKPQTLTVFFWPEYILKTDTILDHLSASSYAKFVGSHEHPKAVIVLYGLENSFYSEGLGECKRYHII